LQRPVRRNIEGLLLDLLFTAYRGANPLFWVVVYEELPLWGALLLLAVGLLCFLFSTGNGFRLVAAVLGALVGLLWAPVPVEQLGLGSADGATPFIAAAAGALIGASFPPAVVFFVYGLPAGLIAGHAAGSGGWVLGFVPAFLLVGALALILHRQAGTFAAVGLGAWVSVLGLLACFRELGAARAALELAELHPISVVAAALLLAVVGTVYQLAMKPAPESLEQKKFEELKAQREREEDEARAKRFAAYSSKRGKQNP
jgi:MFS family permease